MNDSASVARPTTGSGVNIASDRRSLTVGPKGPTVLYDVVQKMVSNYSDAGQETWLADHGAVQPVPEVAS